MQESFNGLRPLGWVGDAHNILMYGLKTCLGWVSPLAH